MDEIDRAIVNRLQGGFPLGERPFLEAAAALGISENRLLDRLRDLLERGVLTRFGPLYDAEKLGGHLSLCAMSVPACDFERVAALVNAHPEVAHNYEREHRFNMWFVVAAAEVEPLLETIERETGYPVMNLPREDEYFVGLRLSA
jgi:DNA-binding Lrp family transcriptional regulator